MRARVACCMQCKAAPCQRISSGGEGSGSGVWLPGATQQCSAGRRRLTAQGADGR